MTSRGELKKEVGRELKSKIEDELIYTVMVNDFVNAGTQTITVTDSCPFKAKWVRVRQISYVDVGGTSLVGVYSIHCNAVDSPSIGHFTNNTCVAPQSLFRAKSHGSSIVFSFSYMSNEGLSPTTLFASPIGVVLEFVGDASS